MKIIEELGLVPNELLESKTARIDSVEAEIDFWIEEGIPHYEGDKDQIKKMKEGAEIFIQLMKFYEVEMSGEMKKWIIIDDVKGYYFVRVADKSRRNQILKRSEWYMTSYKQTDEECIDMINEAIKLGKITSNEGLNQWVQENIKNCWNLAFDDDNVPTLAILLPAGMNPDGSIKEELNEMYEIEDQEDQYFNHISLKDSLASTLEWI